MILNLKKILDDRNISVNQLHKMTGISRTTLDPLAKSDTVPQKTRMETLERIAKELNINLNELIVFEDTLNLEVKILERYSHYYESYERKMRDRLILECTFKGKRYLFFASSSYYLDDYFEKKYSEEFKILDNLVLGFKDEKGKNFDNAKQKFIDSEFDKISDYISQEAYKYNSKKITFTRSDILITDFYFHSSKRYSIPEEYKEDMASYSNFSDLIMNDIFLKKTVSLLADYYDFQNCDFFEYNSPLSRAFDDEVFNKVLPVDYLEINFTCENETFKKEVSYFYKKNQQ